MSQNIVKQVNVGNWGVIEVRKDTQNINDVTGEIVSVRYHRYCYNPGDTIPPDEDQRIINLAAQLWTPAVLRAYQKHLADANLRTQ